MVLNVHVRNGVYSYESISLSWCAYSDEATFIPMLAAQSIYLYLIETFIRFVSLIHHFMKTSSFKSYTYSTSKAFIRSLGLIKTNLLKANFVQYFFEQIFLNYCSLNNLNSTNIFLFFICYSFTSILFHQLSI